MQRAGLLKKIWSEALPFIARSPEMKVDWLVGIVSNNSLTKEEIAPYIHILLSEYKHAEELGVDLLPDLFAQIPKNIILELLKCTEIYDIPLLLKIIKTITEEEAVLVLKKKPPVYEKQPMQVLDLVFQAVHDCDEHLLDKAKSKMQAEGDMPKHFNSVYERFQELLKDKEILSSIFPHAKMTTTQSDNSLSPTKKGMIH
jgi:hypothetical protein